MRTHMTWLEIVLAALIAGVLLGSWYRYSIEKGRLRRIAELYLWLGPILPLSVVVAIHGSVGFAAFVPVGIVHLGLIGTALRAVTAPAAPAGTMPRLAGGLLILGSTIVWLGAVTWPGMRLDQVASHRADHWFTSSGLQLGQLVTQSTEMGFVISLDTLARSTASVVILDGSISLKCSRYRI